MKLIFASPSRPLNDDDLRYTIVTNIGNIHHIENKKDTKNLFIDYPIFANHYLTKTLLQF